MVEKRDLRVLIVDDDPDIRHLIRRALEREAAVIFEAGDGPTALALARAAAVDVVILDVHLPGMSGLEVIRELRRHGDDVHVIMASAAGAVDERVSGLMSGADEYLAKPFSPSELAARVLVAGRRRATRRPSLVLGPMRIDASRRVVTIDGRPVALTRLEHELLLHFASHPDTTFSRDELLRAVWPSAAKEPSLAAVAAQVRRLRSKLARHGGDRWIDTVRGVGYRFEAPQAAAALGALPHRRPANATVVIVGNDIVSATEEAAQLVRATSESVIGRDLFTFIAPQSLEAMIARRTSARQGGWPPPELITLRRDDGDEVLVEIASTPVSWHGEPASQVTMWESPRDGARLRELATGLRTEVADAVLVLDRDLTIQSLNLAAADLYGWREEEVIGRPLLDVIPPGPGEEATLTDALESLLSEGRWHGELVHQRRDGAPVAVRSSLTALKDATGASVGIVAVNRPATRSVTTLPSPGDAAVAADIRRGLANDEFEVHYQPVVDLADREVGGMEALVRWQHPQRGLLLPGAFIGAAESSGDIVDLGNLVLTKACREAQRWRAEGDDLSVAVNLSARQLVDRRTVEQLERILAQTSMPPEKLWLEVTETALVEDLDHATEVLTEIDRLGVRITIDDFGTGWASLTYLHSFPVHCLKIDRIFVAGLDTSPRDTAIVNSVLALGRELELMVVAEGIETEAAARRLHDLGCRFGQGYLFGRPLPPSDLARSRRSRCR